MSFSIMLADDNVTFTVDARVVEKVVFIAEMVEIKIAFCVLNWRENRVEFVDNCPFAEETNVLVCVDKKRKLFTLEINSVLSAEL